MKFGANTSKSLNGKVGSVKSLPVVNGKNVYKNLAKRVKAELAKVNAALAVEQVEMVAA